MTPSPLASLRRLAASGLILITVIAVGGCSTPDSSATPDPASPTPTVQPSATPAPTPEPTPTPAPTPRFTNPPDSELRALLPDAAGGVPLVVPDLAEFALTPGDFGRAYGEIGDRFASLAIGYMEQPRLSIYAARVDGEGVDTEDLEPYLETAGRYVGIAGLHREPWELTDAGGTLAWVRPEDNATALGTMIYTWSSGDVVFLLIGVDDAVNRALIAELPGQPAPTPTPTPTPEPSPGTSATDEATPSPSGS